VKRSWANLTFFLPTCNSHSFIHSPPSFVSQDVDSRFDSNVDSWFCNNHPSTWNSSRALLRNSCKTVFHFWWVILNSIEKLGTNEIQWRPRGLGVDSRAPDLSESKSLHLKLARGQLLIHLHSYEKPWLEEWKPKGKKLAGRTWDSIIFWSSVGFGFLLGAFMCYLGYSGVPDNAVFSAIMLQLISKDW